MKKISTGLVCCLAAMLLTIVLYFTILGNIVLTAIHFICLVAILLSEAITTGYICTANGSPRKIAAAVVSAFMIPFALVLSVVYIINFPEGYLKYIGWYCSATVVVNIIAYILIRFDTGKSNENLCFQDAKNNMLGLRKIVKCILTDPAAQPYAAQLKALEEKLHFSNDRVIAIEDEDIRNLLLQLQEQISNPEFDCVEMIQKICQTVDKRNIMCK